MLLYRKLAKLILIFGVFCLCFFFLNSSLAIAKKYPTIKIIKNVSITKDTILNVILPNGCLVSGKIEDSAGKPLENASINVSKINSLFMNFSSTNEKGKYKISLLPGTYDFRFDPPPLMEAMTLSSAANSRATTKFINNVQISKAKKFNIKLQNGLFLEGNVINDLALPAGGSVLYAEDLSEERVYTCAVDSDNGNFKIALPACLYALNMIRSAQFPEDVFPTYGNKNIGQIDLKGDAWMDVIMPKGVQVKGNVKDKRGKPVIAAIFFINRADCQKKNPWVRNTVTFTQDPVKGISYYAGLIKGKYTAQVMPLHYEGSEAEYSNKATVKIITKNIKRNKKLNITLNDGFTLSGTVKDKKGKKAEFAAVLITNIKKPADIFNKTKFIAVTAAIEGKYYYPLPNGSYDVYFIPPPPDFSVEIDELTSPAFQKGFSRLKNLHFINLVVNNFLDNLK